MKHICALLFTLLILFTAIPVTLASAAVPDALQGTWAGVGTPVGKGSAISLTFTVAADGTGSYTFQQSGYQESYPFTLQSDTGTFTVSIPENNQLGIVACEGTYALAADELTLAVTTTFTNNRKYAYTAVCARQTETATPKPIADASAAPTVSASTPPADEPALSPSPTAETAPETDTYAPLQWKGKTLLLDLVTEDETVINYQTAATNDPRKEGERLIKLVFTAEENPLTAEEMTSFGTTLSLRDEQANLYTSSLFTNVRITIKDGAFSLSDSQPTIGLLFAVPETTALNTLTLTAEGSDAAYTLHPIGEAKYAPESTDAPQ